MNKSETQSKINVYISNDHAGFEMKELLLKDKRLDFINFIDVGATSNQSVDYPDYALKLGEAVLKNKCYGIAICGTGIGISIALNKIKGIYTAVINNPEVAKLAREHNNLNVISLSSTRFTTVDNNVEIIKNFFASEFDTSGRHQNRLNKIKDIENNNL